MVAARPRDFALLDRGHQQFLRGRSEFRQLIDIQRPAGCLFQQPWLEAVGGVDTIQSLDRDLIGQRRAGD